MDRLKLFVLIAIILTAASLNAQQLKVIPYPKQVEMGAGKVTVTSATRIALTAKGRLLLDHILGRIAASETRVLAVG